MGISIFEKLNTTKVSELLLGNTFKWANDYYIVSETENDTEELYQIFVNLQTGESRNLLGKNAQVEKINLEASIQNED